jgi:hypothetical protein
LKTWHFSQACATQRRNFAIFSAGAVFLPQREIAFSVGLLRRAMERLQKSHTGRKRRELGLLATSAMMGLAALERFKATANPAVGEDTDVLKRRGYNS